MVPPNRQVIQRYAMHFLEVCRRPDVWPPNFHRLKHIHSTLHLSHQSKKPGQMELFHFIGDGNLRLVHQTFEQESLQHKKQVIMHWNTDLTDMILELWEPIKADAKTNDINNIIEKFKESELFKAVMQERRGAARKLKLLIPQKPKKLVVPKPAPIFRVGKTVAGSPSLPSPRFLLRLQISRRSRSRIKPIARP